MATITIKIKGLNKLRSQFVRHPQIVGEHVSKAINKTIEAIRAKTVPITPVDTGRLAASYARDSRQATPTRLFGLFASNVEYAGFVHDIRPAGQRYKRPSKNKSAIKGFLFIGVERAENQIDKNFQDAADSITRDLSK